MRELLANYSEDAGLAGLVPVGWYHSHTRGGLSLSATDIELHHRYFPEPWQVALLLQPRDARPTRVGLFLREPDGTMPQRPNCEFEAGPVSVSRPPVPRDELAAPEEAAEPAPKPVSAEAVPAAEAAPAPAAPPMELFTQNEEKRRAWLWPLVAVGLVLLGAGLVLPSLWRRTPPPAALALRLVEKDGRLDIKWDPATPALRQAQKGWLEIADGAVKVVFPLDANLLRAGAWPVVRQSPEVRVRLKVERAGAEPLEESVQFLGPAPAVAAAPTPPSTPSAKGTVQEEVTKLRAELEGQLAESSRLERRLKALQEESRVAEAPAPPRRSPPRRVFPAPLTAAHRPPAEVPGPPQISPPPAAAPPVTPGRLSETAPAPPPPAERAAPQPAPAAETLKPAPAYQGPKSGKLMWTGFLPANSVLTIENRRPSNGHLTGELPAVPYRAGASPAEFMGGGLTVYSANSRFVRGPVTEPPGAQNGWNRTVYRYDLRLARDLVVIEAPGPQNGWNRVVLRSGERQLSVILLEWEIIP
jgi:hypothetical protein